MLTSRKISTSDFTDDFYSTILPGLIPRTEFIKWPVIDLLLKTYDPELKNLKKAILGPSASTKDKLNNYLAESAHPLVSLGLLFRLLGHTGDVYVSLEERIDIAAEAKHIAAKDEFSNTALDRITTTLIEIGIDKILDKDLSEILLGVSIGLETHRRKNGGGTAFKNLVGDFLEECVAILRERYPSIELKSEVAIMYSNGRQSKNVDFAYIIDKKPIIGFEANFYTSTGSKPTEIKRSYAQVRRDLEEVGVELVWITDGEGYMKMRKSLTDAQETHPNIYNYSMLKRYLFSDILEYMKTED